MDASQILGLVGQSVVGFIIGGLYEPLTKHIAAFAVMYGVFLSFGQVGPGNCTLVLSAKTGPTAVRGTFYGFAAAAGKAGAFVGIWGEFRSFSVSYTLSQNVSSISTHH